MQLVNLLSSITNSVSAAKELGRKSNIVEHGKNKNRGMGMGMMSGSYDGDRANFLGSVMGGGGSRDAW